MSTQVQRRKGTTAQHASFTGASAELTVDTTKNTVVVHDGATAGGIPLAKETGSALSVTSLVSSGAASIEATDTAAALRITQLGSGNALLVEDSSNPDSSPFVIDTAGRVAIGHIATVAGNGPSSSTRPSLQVHGLTNSTSGAGVYNWSSTAALTSAVTFNRSLSNTVGTFGGAVASSTSLGAISFSGDDGTSFYESVRILAQADGSATTGSTPGRLLFFTTPSGSTTVVERMRIASNGDISIAGGTANGVTYLNGSKVLTSGTALTFDGTNLGVNGGVGVSIKNISAVTQANLRLGSTFPGSGNNTDWSIIQSFSVYGDLVFRSGTAEGDDPRVTGSTRFQFLKDGTSIWNVAGSEAMRLTSTGLGIGTTSPSYKLDIYGSGTPVAAVRSSATGDAKLYLECAGTNSGYVSYNRSLQALTFSANNSTNHAILDSSGNLGLGVTPSAWSGVKAFELVGADGYGRGSLAYSSNSLVLSSNAYYNGTNWIYQSTAASIAATRYIQSSGAHQWWNSPTGVSPNTITFTQAMTLDASGNLLVGTTTAGLVNSHNYNYTPGSGRGYYNHVSGTGNGADYLIFGYNATQIGSITQSGTTAVLYNVTSDQRLKENIVDAPEFGSVIDSIKVRSYDWKTDQTHQRAGFIAQELVVVAPEAVHQPENPEEMMAVDYSKLVPMLVKEIQDLRKRLAAANL